MWEPMLLLMTAAVSARAADTRAAIDAGQPSRKYIAMIRILNVLASRSPYVNTEYRALYPITLLDELALIDAINSKCGDNFDNLPRPFGEILDETLTEFGY